MHLILSTIDRLPDHQRDSVEQWITPGLQTLADSIAPRFISQIPELELDDEDPFEDGLFETYEVNGDPGTC